MRRWEKTVLVDWVCLIIVLPALTAYGQEIKTISFQGKRFTVCRVDPRETKLELYLRDESGTAFTTFDRLDTWLRSRGRQLVFAMNAGMFHPDFSPVGLYVEHGKQLRPLNLRKGKGNFSLMPNGVFAVVDSKATVVESSQYYTLKGQVSLATQSGPLLVIDGRIHQAFMPNSNSRLYRNGVGVSRDGRAVFAITEEPVNFYEFALLFRDGLECPNALFLDGSISSLYAPELGRNDFSMGLGPIIAVTHHLRHQQ